jgi:predicted ATPase
LTLDAPQRRQRILDACKQVLLRYSQAQPLLLICEDVHWADAETQALLDALVESLPRARLLLLITYRPEYQHGWGSKTYYTQVRLDPLPPVSTDELLQVLLGEDPSLDLLKRLLNGRTEGNPFFLEESVQTLVETQVLGGAPGAYRLTHPLPTMQVPTTVQAVLAARLDRLPLEAKHLLQTAAVIGHDVLLALLAAIAECAEDVLHHSLAQLQRAEFLYETRLWPDHAYTFKHALTHEMAYGSLLQERRQALHARIVEVLEMEGGDRLAGQVEPLAHHALRGAVWDKALAYCRQAGEKAMARSAYREAVGYFEQALSALSHLPEKRDTLEQAIDLRLALRSALRLIGNFGRALACLREAESLAVALDDPRRLAQVSIFLSVYFFLMGAHDQAIAAGQHALALATTGGDVTLQALANQYLGIAYQAQGDYRRAIDCLKQAVTSFDGAQRRERFGQAQLPAVLSRAHLAWCHAELGTFAEGSTLGEEGIRIGEAVAHPASLITAYHNLGRLCLCKGDLPRALPLLERAVGLCQNTNFPVMFPATATTLGAAYTLAGRIDDAVLLLTQAIEQATTMKRGAGLARCRLSLGEAQMLAGRLEEARALAERALTLARQHQERGYQVYALRLLGEIAARRGPPAREQAADYYHQALTLADELGMRPLVAHCHLGLGTLYAKTGQHEQARAALSTATDLYRAMDMTFWLPQVEAAFARVAHKKP